ncbi:MFS transporter, DHA2 family, multidrug resistance protein [Enhydrobacter aerosaccus]|uniref:MFS transporter, DHA2 family, multidrug resistance protein n=1 Tax=Enhydrobacter aerosaccus TaxID=225324 RepID=A0A1T4K6Q7_9HYPH|nr:DHA2 family efflux MFS transporter permease subunit [Enhydrobacter aerosaccus]SJZ38017.1 MFS transporter, DHA2 family, multidrug resistance protein [Enhydrobacter aerosaccus]
MSNRAGAGPEEFAAVPYHGIITLSVMLATIMQALDSTIANVALPHMQGAVSGTQDEMGWVLTSYIVAAAITIPLTGWLSNAFGRRRVFLISIVIFTIASALCGLAETLPQIVLFRLLQGIGGAALVPLSQAVLFDINPPRNYGRAMSIWGVGVTMGPILGPALGGWLTDNYSWRWVFYINLPIGVLAFVGLLLTLPESRQTRSSGFDFFGFATLSLGVAALQLMLDRGQLLDWFSSTEIMIEAAASGLGFYLFIVHMFTTDHPFVDPALFKDRNFLASNVFIFLVGIVLFATLALLPPMLQNQLGYPVVLTGLVTAPRGLGTLIGMFAVGRLLSLLDARHVIAAGLALTAYSLWRMTHFSLQMDYWPIVFSGVLQGLGIGLVYVPLSTVAFSTLPVALRNEGTALFSLMRNIGSSIGISVVTFLLTQNVQRLHLALGTHITPYNVASNPAARAAHVDVSSARGVAALDAMINNQATMIAYIDDFKLMMTLTLVTIPLLLLLKRAKPQAGAHAAVLD